MGVFAISDLHLSFAAEKPMDVFGENWRDHHLRIRAAWEAAVTDQDLVLIPGDISWAMQLSAALPDLSFIGDLPGVKLLMRGNHDYWWSSLTQVRSALPEGVHALQNDAFVWGDLCVCGTRGWFCPGCQGFTEQDRKIYERELQRLTLSLDRAVPGKRLLVMTHFPPFNEKNPDSGFTQRIAAAGAEMSVYGHLHGAAHKGAFTGLRDGVRYTLVSADYIGFAPVQLL